MNQNNLGSLVNSCGSARRPVL